MGRWVACAGEEVACAACAACAACTACAEEEVACAACAGVEVAVAEDWSCLSPSPGPPGNQAFDWCWQGCGCHGHLEGACCKIMTEEEGGAKGSLGCSSLKQILSRAVGSSGRRRGSLVHIPAVLLTKEPWPSEHLSSYDAASQLFQDSSIAVGSRDSAHSSSIFEGNTGSSRHRRGSSEGECR